MNTILIITTILFAALSVCEIVAKCKAAQRHTEDIKALRLLRLECKNGLNPKFRILYDSELQKAYDYLVRAELNARANPDHRAKKNRSEIKEVER